MAWSPFQRANAGIIWVEQPGDYANPIPTTSATGPVGEQRRDFQGHEPVHPASQRMDANEQIGRPGKILDGEREEQRLARFTVVQLPANFRVVRLAAGNGVVEDRRIGGEAGDKFLGDVALERAAIE